MALQASTISLRDEEASIVLGARVLAYKTLSSLYAHELDDATLAVLQASLVWDAFDLLNVFEDAAYDASVRAARAAAEALGAGGAGVADDAGAADDIRRGLASDFTRLFVGPAKLLAAPWESVYRTKERLIFQQCTLDVRNAYRAAGYLPAEYPHVADDHLSLELDFMGLLAERLQATCLQDDTEPLGASASHASMRLRDLQVDFLSQHLLYWIHDFADAVCRANVGAFYPAFSRLAAAFVRLDARLMEDMQTP